MRKCLVYVGIGVGVYENENRGEELGGAWKWIGVERVRLCMNKGWASGRRSVIHLTGTNFPLA